MTYVLEASATEAILLNWLDDVYNFWREVAVEAVEPFLSEASIAGRLLLKQQETQLASDLQWSQAD